MSLELRPFWLKRKVVDRDGPLPAHAALGQSGGDVDCNAAAAAGLLQCSEHYGPSCTWRSMGGVGSPQLGRGWIFSCLSQGGPGSLSWTLAKMSWALGRTCCIWKTHPPPLPAFHYTLPQNSRTACICLLQPRVIGIQLCLPRRSWGRGGARKSLERPDPRPPSGPRPPNLTELLPGATSETALVTSMLSLSLSSPPRPSPDLPRAPASWRPLLG